MDWLWNLSFPMHKFPCLSTTYYKIFESIEIIELLSNYAFHLVRLQFLVLVNRELFQKTVHDVDFLL